MICAIVLAAGRSERMGTQKLLLPLDGKPIIARIVDKLKLRSLAETIVVVGSEGEKIRHALDGRVVTFVTNQDGAGDMLSSLRCGLGATPVECTAFLIVLGDQPNITTGLITQLINAFTESGDGIVMPTNDGRRGHPVLIAARFRDELLSRHDGTGLRGLLNAHPDEIHLVGVSDATALADMDTPEDYQRHLHSTAA